MTLHVVALETKQFVNKYYSLENAARQASFADQMQAANHVLKNCIEECQITRFSGDLMIPDKPIFDGWADALPDLNILKTCLQFLRALQNPGFQKQKMPWWIKNASFDVALIDPQSLKQYSQNVHECKFYEVLLANIVTGNAAYQYIELGEFLELSAINDCGLLAWSHKDALK